MAAKLLSPTVVQIDGEYPPAKVAAFGRALQARIARAYEASRTWGGALKPNTQSYTVWKISQGLDIRRGWATGKLGAAIANVKCWTARKVSGGWRIEFSDNPLMGAVDYAKYYREAKVPGLVIMGVIPAWVKEAEPVLGKAAPVDAKKQPKRQPATARASGGQVIRSPSVSFIRRLLGQEVRV